MNFTKQFRSSTQKAVLATLGLAAGLGLTSAVVHAAGNLADGWSVRADSGAGADDKLTMEGADVHVVTGGPPTMNGTFFNPAWTSTGNHTFSATLSENTKATHPDAYGLMFGGSNIADENQSYTYFEVRQAGEFYIATRKGGSGDPGGAVDQECRDQA